MGRKLAGLGLLASLALGAGCDSGMPLKSTVPRRTTTQPTSQPTKRSSEVVRSYILELERTPEGVVRRRFAPSSSPYNLEVRKLPSGRDYVVEILRDDGKKVFYDEFSFGGDGRVTLTLPNKEGADEVKVYLKNPNELRFKIEG